ncbi:D-Ala-D-Ala carboxypeptidase VanY [Heyndrickxia ginsengihumi]|uniref:D-Ala-D-Ala carboxypeptidase VanY n=1 Tax=Heyndrickxia ginsengihumi TaxID=363870 RepID=A0A0A6Y174_9BACI|nr:D-Ala-D-Ala carboxypeptidase VanY [Heyndrickxia ginsengihumi]KHD86047.1 peptidase M15 [Heyndrickxia ginsengihumi]MBE6184240.1 D-Ala-D-Ala carboxypeptidase VanY [Bacillus sp. (in: firmicutes)]MCM3023464.1 D-Ala-D-Ala carboxypeptidase VanY [Heyndrickxia ginsengihumi]NEY20380.1 D-Ala-D-Ala carboxypeptidase VanY [Heyndrickxia ginsengihumi]
MKQFVSLGLVLLLLTGCSFNPLDQATKEQSNKTSEKIDANNQDNAKKSELALSSKYFNHIKTVNGQKIIQNPSNILALVNKSYSIGDYVPNDLVRPKVNFSFGDQNIEKSHLRKVAADAVEKMFAAAKKDGIILYVASGYRSYDRQKVLFDAEVQHDGSKAKAAQAVAIPGESEHQTGLALDITSQTENFLLTEKMGDDPEGIWLAKNAHKFGFILRYPKGKENITKYEYEPWHFRYVGKEAATVIYKHNWTLEEYFQHVKKV